MEQLHIDVKKYPYAATIAPEQVRGLSLGKVTERYGTYGLYIRTLDTLDRRGFSENELIQQSLDLGIRLHFNEKRTNGNYIDHLMRVMLHVIEDFNIEDQDIIAACPLHDIFENHPFNLVLELTGNRIRKISDARTIGKQALINFTNSGVVEIVSDVTNPDVAPGEDKQKSYTKHTTDLIFNHQKSRVVKLADFIDNAVGNHATIGEKQLKLDKKYIDLYQVHEMGLFLPDSLIVGEERQKALHTLSEGHTRALSRLATHGIY